MKRQLSTRCQGMLRTITSVLMLVATPTVVIASDNADALDGSSSFSLKIHGAVNAMTERCHFFTSGGVVNFSFSSRYPLDFNVHHHGEEATEFPVKLTDVANHQGQFLAEAEHEYCFMWQNQTFSHEKWLVDLEFELTAVESAAR